MRTIEIRTQAWELRPASPKQVDLITRLAAERGLEISTEGMNGGEASKIITTLLGQNRQQHRSEAHPDLQPGVHEVDGTVYVVQRTRDGQRLYAKRLVESAARVNEADDTVRFDYEYDRGAVFQIRPEHRVTRERAEELAVRYGQCLDCGRHLKAEKSVRRGIGPVCAGKYR